MMVNFLMSPRKRYSEERLRVAYIDLLEHIDWLDRQDLGQRRRVSEEDLECHKKAKRFSLRRSVIPSNHHTTASGGRTGLPTCDFLVEENPTQDVTSIFDYDDTTTTTTTTSVSTAAATARTSMLQPTVESRDAPNSDYFSKDTNNHPNKVDLTGAFRILAATKSPDKEGDNHGAIAVRDDGSVVGIQRAQAIEKRAVELIALIGEIVVNGGGTTNRQTGSSNSVRTDPVFEYFCEKCILSLLVDIAKEVRQGKEAPRRNLEYSVHGVVWSGLVKAQVYQTVSILISDARNQSILYYLLSNNYINELIQCMLPLQQWTEPAMQRMLPAYVDLLRQLTLQLADDPDLFPFLTLETRNNHSNDDRNDRSSNATSAIITNKVDFPLFSATLETATSYYCQSDSQSYTTCMAIIIKLMQIEDAPIQMWLSQSSSSHRILADYLSHQLLDRFFRITRLATGPVVDGIRSNAIAGQFESLKDHMGMIQEFFWSGVRGLEVRLCESLLQRVVTVLLKSLSQTPPRRPFLSVGMIDADVIPESEAVAQVSTVLFMKMFMTLEYAPFQRMLGVALLHPKSAHIWSTLQWTTLVDTPDSYVFMPVLSDIVNDVETRETSPNPFRAEVVKTLRGDYGEWRTTAAAFLLQSIMCVETMDSETLYMLQIISRPDSGDPTSIEEAVAAFLGRTHKPSAVSSKSLECMGYLAVLILYHDITTATRNRSNDIDEVIKSWLSSSPVLKALLTARDFFAERAMTYREVTGVSDIFLDLLESAIKGRYTPRYNESGSASFTCLLSRRGFVKTSFDSDVLVRQLRDVSSNDVETTRFYINMSLHFRAVCKVIDRLCLAIERQAKLPRSSPKVKPQRVTLDMVDTADDLLRTIGGLVDKPEVGAELDLTGRMSFPFQSALKKVDLQSSGGGGGTGTTATTNQTGRTKGGKATPSDDNLGVFRSTAHLMLVLDPTDLFVVKPRTKKYEGNRGTVLCGISLRSIIAAAPDGAWLHVAVRHDDVGFLVKNGNMALKFESPGTCLIVKQYLDRSREVLRQDLLTKVPDLLRTTMVETSGTAE